MTAPPRNKRVFALTQNRHHGWPGADEMNDQNQSFLQKLLFLYQELLAHDGYGDLSISIRRLNSREKEVRLLCGREYRFRVTTAVSGAVPRQRRSYFPVPAKNWSGYDGPERRSGQARRERRNLRRTRNEPRHFKLERRMVGERRSGWGRRRDD